MYFIGCTRGIVGGGVGEKSPGFHLCAAIVISIRSKLRIVMFELSGQLGLRIILGHLSFKLILMQSIEFETKCSDLR